MEAIICDIERWEKFFLDLEELRLKNGSMIVREAIRDLDNILKGMIIENEVFNELSSLGIKNIKDAYRILEKLVDVYQFTRIIEQIRRLINYGVSKLALLKSDAQVCYIKPGYTKIYTGKDVIPYEVEETNEVEISTIMPFILEFNQVRILLVSDFYLNIDSLYLERKLVKNTFRK